MKTIQTDELTNRLSWTEFTKLVEPERNDKIYES